MKKRILVVSQYFFPEQFRINDICEEWVKRGYAVTVLTGIPNYPQGKYYEGYGLFRKRKDRYRGVDIIRIPLIPRGNNKVPRLMINYLSFVASGMVWNLVTRIKADYIFIFEVSPMTQALPGVRFAKKHKIPCYLYVQDLWPESFEIITGIKNKRIVQRIGRLVDKVYRSSSMIFTTSESLIRAIEERGVPRDKLKYWPQYAEDFYVPLEKSGIPEIPQDDCFHILFAGNIGRAQGLEVLPKAASILKRRGFLNVRFDLVGDGRFKNDLMHLVDSEGVSELFHFIPRQPATRIPEFMAACDVAFLSLSDHPLFKMAIPAKLQSYMACAMPTIASAEGEIERIIAESRSGRCSKPEDAEALVEHIVELSSLSKQELEQLGADARAYYDIHFDKETLLAEMDTYFNERRTIRCEGE